MKKVNNHLSVILINGEPNKSFRFDIEAQTAFWSLIDDKLDEGVAMVGHQQDLSEETFRFEDGTSLTLKHTLETESVDKSA